MVNENRLYNSSGLQLKAARHELSLGRSVQKRPKDKNEDIRGI